MGKDFRSEILNDLKTKRALQQFESINPDFSNIDDVYTNNLNVWYFWNSDRTDNEQGTKMDIKSNMHPDLKPIYISKTQGGFQLFETDFINDARKQLQILEFENLTLIQQKQFSFYTDYLNRKLNSFSKPETTEKYLGQPTNKNANDFFDFLIEYYRLEDKTQIKYVNILHYLKNDADKKHFIFRVKQSEYKILVCEKTGIDIKKFAKSERYNDDEKPIFHSLENTFLKTKAV